MYSTMQERNTHHEHCPKGRQWFLMATHLWLRPNALCSNNHHVSFRTKWDDRTRNASFPHVISVCLAPSLRQQSDRQTQLESPHTRQCHQCLIQVCAREREHVAGRSLIRRLGHLLPPELCDFLRLWNCKNSSRYVKLIFTFLFSYSSSMPENIPCVCNIYIVHQYTVITT